MPSTDTTETARERILDTAESLFAQRGFDGVTVRQITSAARCNLAAVNYHFGNKKSLYLEVFRSRWVPRAKRLQAHFRANLADQASMRPDAAAVARSLAHTFLAGPMTDEERQRHHQLMSREMGRPTEAFQMVAEDVIRPFFKELAELLRPALPKTVDQEGLSLNLLSILALVLYFNFAREAVTRITGRKYDKAFKDRLVDHIVTFVRNGLGCERMQGEEVT
ncbi:MAG: CerR family C-terminal domain-containing protein [Deltaproteobacteria bacterium]|nr:CerR family C-terminal domain-containing protein [Deltaproteobacteria bacterium]